MLGQMPAPTTAAPPSVLQSPLVPIVFLLIVIPLCIFLWRRRGKTRCGICLKWMSGNFCKNCGAARPRRAIPLD
jgi:hypothetical protein